MKKAALIVLALLISVVFVSTGFTQDKPAAAPADKAAVAAPEKKDDGAVKETKKAKKAKKAKAKKEAKPAEDKAAAPAEKAPEPAKK
ncbi:MAG TPA: hypothetical protein VGJ94_08675 [Syntrophorhabdaceae bacterium]|jgi:hypothetical protein